MQACEVWEDLPDLAGATHVMRNIMEARFEDDFSAHSEELERMVLRTKGQVEYRSPPRTNHRRHHQYRSNWNVDPSTGHYNSNIPSPTGIVADPALASYGVAQAKQLGGHLLKVSPSIDKIYSSPFYRCLQTLQPFTTARHEQSPGSGVINVEPGVGEFYGLARFDHPSPAPIEELRKHFPHLEKDATPVIVPSTKVSVLDV